MRCVVLAQVASVLLLVACSGRPEPDLLRPQAVAEPAGARIVRVYSVTTRATDPDAPWAYGATPSARPQFGAFDISIPPAHEAGQIEWPRSAEKADAARDFVTLEQEKMDRATLLAQHGHGKVAVMFTGSTPGFRRRSTGWPN